MILTVLSSQVADIDSLLYHNGIDVSAMTGLALGNIVFSDPPLVMLLFDSSCDLYWRMVMEIFEVCLCSLKVGDKEIPSF